MELILLWAVGLSGLSLERTFILIICCMSFLTCSYCTERNLKGGWDGQGGILAYCPKQVLASVRFILIFRQREVTGPLDKDGWRASSFCRIVSTFLQLFSQWLLGSPKKQIQLKCALLVPWIKKKFRLPHHSIGRSIWEYSPWHPKSRSDGRARVMWGREQFLPRH